MLIYGKEIADGIISASKIAIEKFASRGVIPVLAMVRIGEKPDDAAYEKAIIRVAEKCGAGIITHALPEDVRETELAKLLQNLSADTGVHGIMLFRPLPSRIDENSIRNLMAPAKDVDGITDASMAWVYSLAPGDSLSGGFAPCTAEAVMRTLDGAGVDAAGKRAVVIGRSLVIGKPVSMLLLAGNATVTVAHSKTPNLAELTRGADIIIVCAGLAKNGREKRLGVEFFRAGQTVIDCGINADADGLYGDVNAELVSALGANVTPVPGGLGSVTTAVLMEHLVRSARVSAEEVNG